METTFESFCFHAVAVQHAPYPVVGVDRHRALFDDYLVAFDGARNFGHDGLDIRQVRGAAIALRSANGNEYGLALLNRLGQMRGKHYPAAAVLRQQLGQVLFKDRHAALAELPHPGFVIVDGDNLMTHVRETSSCYQPNVSGADHAN